MTQVDILDTINNANNKYIAKVKYNQKSLRDKVELTVNDFYTPSEVYEDADIFQTEENKSVKRKVEIYDNRDCDIVLYDSKFRNICPTVGTNTLGIQTLIKTTKETFNSVTGEIKTTR